MLYYLHIIYFLDYLFLIQIIFIHNYKKKIHSIQLIYIQKITVVAS